MNFKSKKIIFLSFFVLLSAAGLPSVGKTAASFSDNETSTTNTLVAGVLSIETTPGSFSQPIDSAPIVQTIAVNHSLSTVLGRYKMTLSENIGSNHSLCLILTGELRDLSNNAILYSGNLLSFDPATTTMGSSSSENYSFRISTSSPIVGAMNGTSCKFSLVVKAWQQNINLPESGFVSTANVTGEISSPLGVVLNEFLPNPIGNDNQQKPNGEWVELYNNSDVPKNLSGWYLRNSGNGAGSKILITTANTNTGSQTIGAKSWLVVYMNKALLNNTRDTVRLFDKNNTLIDSYTYALPADYCALPPTPGGTNNQTGSGTGTCKNTIQENKSYARIPDGVGAWVDPIPTPGEPNIFDPEMEIVANVENQQPEVQETELPPEVTPNTPAMEETPLLEQAIETGKVEDPPATDAPMETTSAA